MRLATNPLTNSGLPARSRTFAGLAALGAALLCAQGAQAQMAGGLGAGVPGVPNGDQRIAIEGHADAAYDSNVTGGNASVASQRRLTPEDEIYSAGTNITLMLPSSRQLLFFDGQAELQRYARNSTLDANNYRLSVGAAERLGICAATLVGGYSHRETQIQQVAVATIAKNIATQDSGNADVTCGRRKIFVDISGGVSKLENSAKTSGFVDSQTVSGNVAVGYHNTVLGDLSLLGVYSDIQYGQDNLLLALDPTLPTSVPDVRQYGVGLRYARKVGLRLSGTASVFYNRIEGGFVHTQSDGLGVTASLAYRMTSRTQFTLDYNLGNNASPLSTTSYVHSEDLHLNATYNLTQRITFQAGVSHQREEYRGADQIALLQLRESDSNQIDGSINIKVGQKLTVILNAQHLERTADVRQFNYNADRVSIGLSGKF
ncbi:outer membrane beta-barrel protein [Phenylobacterium sp.]|jgi:hypothetical protein|uniref:outer membrane beta-barrel protein n=1 Tax=Phenylobacterium sp. TaxID=1871053 RepID=UPI002F42CDC3